MINIAIRSVLIVHFLLVKVSKNTVRNLCFIYTLKGTAYATTVDFSTPNTLGGTRTAFSTPKGYDEPAALLLSYGIPPRSAPLNRHYIRAGAVH